MTHDLLRLLAWLSPSFPVGSFSYSHGLESAVETGRAGDRDALRDWIDMVLRRGSGWNDAVVLCDAWRRAGDGGDLAELNALAEALAGSKERHLESTLQGAAFRDAVAAWSCPALDALPEGCLYCVAVGAAARDHGIACQAAVAAFLQAFASNLLQAAIRLGVIGQTAGVALLAELEETISDTARRAVTSSLDDLGALTIMAEVAAMRHETLYSRLFRS